jgi:hypothetical protein
MAYKVIEEMKRKRELWSGNKAISDVVGKINNTLSEIEDVNAKQKITSAGATKKKTKIRKELDNLSNVFLGSFRSYARQIDDVQLYEKYDLTITEIRKVKDTEVIGESKSIIAFATEHLKELKDFGTTQKMVDEYKLIATNFREVLALPQIIIAERRTLTQKLKDLFKQLDEMLNEDLDNYMMQFITKNPDFYSDYENARVIYDDVTISKSLMGKVTGGEAEIEVITYVTITVKFKAGTDWKEYTARTSKKGNYQFKGLPEGKCTVTFQKNYYETLTIESEVHNNEMTRLNVQMKKKEKI